MDQVSIAYLIARYLHIVCSTLLVGGTLFYEMVVPVAIADLKPETQLAIFGRARWMFRQIVWASALVLVLSGFLSAGRHWPAYRQGEQPIDRMNSDGSVVYGRPPTVAARPGWWMVAHATAGMMAVMISVALTLGGTPPGHPIQWMRVNLIILMIVIFMGSATRHVRIDFEQQTGLRGNLDTSAVPAFAPGDFTGPDALLLPAAATHPSTRPDATGDADEHAP